MLCAVLVRRGTVLVSFENQPVVAKNAVLVLFASRSGRRILKLRSLMVWWPVTVIGSWHVSEI